MLSTLREAPKEPVEQADITRARGSAFDLEGSKPPVRRSRAHYRSVGKPENYRCEFHPGPHKFDAKMQKSALKWLKQWLQG